MKNIKSFIKQLLTEARFVTYTGEIMGQISKSIPDLKRLDLRGFASGTMGLFRYKDGNAYEIVIRPVKYSEFKDYYGDLVKKKIDRPGFKPNKDEPLSIDQVKGIIKSHLSGENIGISINSFKNTKKVYGFKVEVSGYNKKEIVDKIKSLMDEQFFTVNIDKTDKGMFDIFKYKITVWYEKL